MERLTKWENGHAYYPRCFENPCYGGGCVTRDCPFETAICKRLAAYEDTGFSPEEIKSAFTTDALIKMAAQALGTTPERLRKLAAADKEGRVVVLPCKVGDTVWLTRTWVSERLSQPKAAALTGAYICGHGVCTFVTDKYGFQQDKIGKDVFLTREEAERALKGRKDG